MLEFLSSPFLGIVLCIFTYEIGLYLKKKWPNPILNPLLVAIVLCIIILKLGHIPLTSFQAGGDIINLFLVPITAILAVPIYRQMEVIRQGWLPILLGALVGSLVSIVSVFLLCQAFHVDTSLMISLLPKSVTTPIAIEVSGSLGGLVPVTLGAVMVTGIFGAVVAPQLIRWFHIKNPIAAGLGIGTSCHAVGTSKALEIGEVEGAMSGIAIGVAGLITVLISLFL